MRVDSGQIRAGGVRYFSLSLGGPGVVPISIRAASLLATVLPYSFHGWEETSSPPFHSFHGRRDLSSLRRRIRPDPRTIRVLHLPVSSLASSTIFYFYFLNWCVSSCFIGGLRFIFWDCRFAKLYELVLSYCFKQKFVDLCGIIVKQKVGLTVRIEIAENHCPNMCLGGYLKKRFGMMWVVPRSIAFPSGDLGGEGLDNNVRIIFLY